MIFGWARSFSTAFTSIRDFYHYFMECFWNVQDINMPTNVLILKESSQNINLTLVKVWSSIIFSSWLRKWQEMTNLCKIVACIIPGPTYWIITPQGCVHGIPLYDLCTFDLFFDAISLSMGNNPNSRCNAPFKCRQYRDKLINNVKLAIAKMFKWFKQ